jgi:hypothetical protein
MVPSEAKYRTKAFGVKSEDIISELELVPPITKLPLESLSKA